MGQEIERKFLVTSLDWKTQTPVYYCQGYLNRDKHRTVRIRVAGESAQLTVKGVNDGATRQEFEYSIPVKDAQAMLKICEQPLIEKHRHVVAFDGFDWEVDEFLGENEGLVVAEIELESANQEFPRPPWVGEEVTEDSRYYNSRLSKNPFTSWA